MPSLLSTLIVLLMGCPSGRDTAEDVAVDVAYGGECASPSACATDLICGGDGICHYKDEAGAYEVDASCLSTPYCAMGLVCSHEGVCTEPGGVGTIGVNQRCAETLDCQAGLECESSQCVGTPLPLWTGAQCESEIPGAFRALFEVPREGQAGEFYRLPFPNTLRVRDGRVDLSAHPSPGAQVAELGDVVGAVLQNASNDFMGFGPQQAVFFRFSDRIDLSTVTLGLPGEGSLSLVDITPGAPEYGVRVSSGWKAHSGRQQYICSNWLAIYPSAGRALQPNHTYAAMVTTDIYLKDSLIGAEQDADFAVMLNPSPPAESALQAAWESYQVFRDFMADQSYPRSSLAAAAVFTVGDPITPLQTLRRSVWESDLPEARGLHLCTSDDLGPYANPADLTRGCVSIQPGFSEVQGTLRLAQYQQGTPPYRGATESGRVAFNVDPFVPKGYREVAFSLTLPTDAPMPEQGWPLVIVGHGPNGNYREFVRSGLAKALSTVTLNDGRVTHAALLSIDLPLHGERDYKERWSPEWLAIDSKAYLPEALFSSPLNPRASQGNVLQAVSEFFSLARWASDTSLSGAESPTGQAIGFDTAQFYYIGLGQSADVGVIFSAHEPLIHSIALGGLSGLRVESLRQTVAAYDQRRAMQVALADSDLQRVNPMLNLMQMTYQNADVVNHAQHVMANPLDGNEAKDVFQLFSLSDQHATEAAQYAAGRSLRLDQVTNGHTALEFVTVVSAPVSENNWQARRTGVLWQTEASGNLDPHDLLYRSSDAEYQLSQYFGTAILDGVPTVFAP